jgi:hypothetical protein
MGRGCRARTEAVLLAVVGLETLRSHLPRCPKFCPATFPGFGPRSRPLGGYFHSVRVPLVLPWPSTSHS